MRRLAAVPVVLALFLLPACGGDDEPTEGASASAAAEASPQELIAQAAEKTTAAGSARMAMKMEIKGGAQSLTTTSTGALEFASQKMRMTTDLGEMGAQIGMKKMEMISDGKTLYMKFANYQQMQLPTPWLKLNLADAAGVPGMESLSQMNNNDPSKTMEILRGASGKIQEVGTEDVRGTSTTHYKATIDVDQALKAVPKKSRADVEKVFAQMGAKTIPTEVWLDEEGLLRRQKLTMDLSKAKGAGSGAPTKSVITFELFDFGAAVNAKPPPANQVTDFKALQGG